MPDREKVIKALTCCTTEDEQGWPLCEKCPYCVNGTCPDLHALHRDALALLKAQEPVKPTWKNGYPLCGECGFKLHWIIEQNNYCPNCGRAVKWE